MATKKARFLFPLINKGDPLYHVYTCIAGWKVYLFQYLDTQNIN